MKHKGQQRMMQKIEKNETFKSEELNKKEKTEIKMTKKENSQK
jgi:hypothetical protein